MFSNSWFRYQKLNYNNKLYLIIRKIAIDQRPIVNVWKEHLNCDTVLKGNDGFFYFLQEVSDIEWEEV